MEAMDVDLPDLPPMFDLQTEPLGMTSLPDQTNFVEPATNAETFVQPEFDANTFVDLGMFQNPTFDTITSPDGFENDPSLPPAF